MNDEEFLKLIEEVEKTCDICCKYKRPPSKPVVCFPLSKEFNESVAMDIKYCENHLVLHLIDHATRFSLAAIIRSKHIKIPSFQRSFKYGYYSLSNKQPWDMEIYPTLR